MSSRPHWRRRAPSSPWSASAADSPPPRPLNQRPAAWRTSSIHPPKSMPPASRSRSRASSCSACSGGSSSSRVTGRGLCAVTLTAITKSARAETVGMIGSGLSRPPSTSTCSPRCTGVITPGTAMEARIASSSGPLWNHTSRWRVRSVATVVTGIGNSSMRTSPTRDSSFSITLLARMAPMGLQVTSTSLRTSK